MKRTHPVFHIYGIFIKEVSKIILIHETRKITALDSEETEIAAINLKLGVKFPVITVQ